jgi:hypothetical protein
MVGCGDGVAVMLSTMPSIVTPKAVTIRPRPPVAVR